MEREANWTVNYRALGQTGLMVSVLGPGCSHLAARVLPHIVSATQQMPRPYERNNVRFSTHIHAIAAA